MLKKCGSKRKYYYLSQVAHSLGRRIEIESQDSWEKVNTEKQAMLNALGKTSGIKNLNMTVKIISIVCVFFICCAFSLLPVHFFQSSIGLIKISLIYFFSLYLVWHCEKESCWFCDNCYSFPS